MDCQALGQTTNVRWEFRATFTDGWSSAPEPKCRNFGGLSVTYAPLPSARVGKMPSGSFFNFLFTLDRVCFLREEFGIELLGVLPWK
jgi:hypothetical protein